MTSATAPSVTWQALPTVTVPSRRSKIGLGFARASRVPVALRERFHCLIRARADVLGRGSEAAPRGDVDRRDLVLEAAGGLGGRGALVGPQGECILLAAADPELAGQQFRRLAHDHVAGRVGQADLEPRDRLEVARAER